MCGTYLTSIERQHHVFLLIVFENIMQSFLNLVQHRIANNQFTNVKICKVSANQGPGQAKLLQSGS